MLIVCPQCRQQVEKATGAVNRARKLGLPVYCGRECAGLARRNPAKLTGDAAKEAKAAYDRNRRAALGQALLEKKRQAYYDRLARDETKVRAAQKRLRETRKQQHLEYCRRPEYRQKKAGYDQQRRANIFYGPFAESFLTLLDLKNEIASRASRTEIYRQNGTLCKTQRRKREYDKAISG